MCLFFKFFSVGYDEIVFLSCNIGYIVDYNLLKVTYTYYILFNETIVEH